VVNVEEGDPIRRRQVLAELENSDYRAQVESARANVVAKEATLRKVINGARRQERAEAWSSVNEAKAVVENAQSELLRRQELFSGGVVSREELYRYSREADVAKAKYQSAVEQHSLVDDHAREEDRSLAEADLQLAQAELADAEARYQKTFIGSPIAGTVMCKHHRSGESVSNSSTVPDPILTIGDRETLRVRVDVDENRCQQSTRGTEGLRYRRCLWEAEVRGKGCPRRPATRPEERSNRRAHRESGHQNSGDTGGT